MQALRDHPSRGLTLAYFHHFIDHHGGRQALDGLSTLDVCLRYVKPATQHANLSLVDFVHAQPDGHTYAKAAEWLISHSWSYKFLDVVDAIDNFCHEHELSHNTSFWFCMFANNQHSVGDPVGMFERWLAAFRTALADTGKLVMVLSPWHNPESLQRSWCVYEVYLSVVLKARFEVALGKNQMADFLVDVQKEQSIDRMKAQINSKHSTATVASDRELIFDLISKQVGFVHLDRIVFDAIQTWVLRTLDKQVSSAATPQARFSWVYTRSRLMVDDLQLASAVAGFQSAVDIFEQELDESFAPGWEAKIFLGNLKARQYLSRELWEPMFDEALPKLENLLGPTHKTTLFMKRRIAGAYFVVGDNARCLVLLREALDVQLQLPEDKDLFKLMFGYGTSLSRQGEKKQAEVWTSRAHEGLARHLGANHRDTQTCLANLAVIYVETGRFGEARPLFEALYDESARTFGATHLQTIQSLMNLAGVLVYLGRYNVAEMHLHACAEHFERTAGLGWVQRNHHLLGKLYLAKGDRTLAISYLNQAHSTALSPHDELTAKLALHDWHFANMALDGAYDSIALIDDFVMKLQAADVAGEAWSYGHCHSCYKPFHGSVMFCSVCAPYSTRFCTSCVAAEGFAAVCGHHQGPWTAIKPPMRYLLERKLSLLAHAGHWDKYATAATQYVAYCEEFQVPDPVEVNDIAQNKSRTWAVFGALLAAALLARRRS